MVLAGPPSLPTELLALTFEHIESKSDLLSLRLACRQNHALVTPRVFHTLKVHPNHNGQKTIEGIARCRHLTEYVHELVFEEDEGGVGSSGTDTKIAIGRNMFSHFAQFTSLKNLRLHFHNKYDEPDEAEGLSEGSAYLRLQRAVFEAIASSLSMSAREFDTSKKRARIPTPSLDLLEIIGIITAPNSIFNGEPWQQLLSCLKQLSIFTVSPDQELRGGHQQMPYVSFLAETLPSILLPASNLTSLTLYFDQPAHPNWHRSWDDIHFPRLTSLSLTNAVFDTLEDEEEEITDGMELFITDHADSLKVLKLHRCWMLCWYDTMTEEPRFWSRVWNNLHQEMQGLEEVDVNVRPTPYARLTEWGYMPEDCEQCETADGKIIPGGGQGTSLPDGTPRTRYEEQLDTDREALEQLIHTAEMRRSKTIRSVCC